MLLWTSYIINTQLVTLDATGASDEILVEKKPNNVVFNLIVNKCKEKILVMPLYIDHIQNFYIISSCSCSLLKDFDWK